MNRIKKIQCFAIATIIILSNYSVQAGLFDSIFSFGEKALGGIFSFGETVVTDISNVAKDIITNPVQNDISSNAAAVR